MRHDAETLRTKPQCPPSSDEIVEFMSQRSTYPGRPWEVRVIETHISWVFLTDRRAYKLKKPVRFDFLDFSTVSLRREACELEVQLNRRMAPDVYLGVVPITMTDSGQLQLGGEGTPVDWVVKMRRLPEERAMDQIIARGELADSDVTRVASKLADFYIRLPPSLVDTAAYRAHIEDHVQNNRRELLNPTHGLDPRIVKRTHAAGLRVLRLHPEVFDERVCDGRVVDGHGDLRPEHIYLTPELPVIDCIEFSSELRQLDVLDELSFLAVECARLGAASVGSRILDEYSLISGDKPVPELLPFCMSYRASVRAKVNALRARQLCDREKAAALESAREYLAMADRYAAALGPPFLLIVRGLTGVGKSVLASAIAESLKVELLGTDRIRADVFGLSNRSLAFDAGKYDPENRRLIYQEMLRQADSLLSARMCVVLDGTFLEAKPRAEAMRLARRHGAVPLVVHCHCPRDLAIERIASRAAAGESLSESRPEFFDRQQRLQEPDPPGVVACNVDTTDSLPTMLGRVFTQLAKGYRRHELIRS